MTKSLATTLALASAGIAYLSYLYIRVMQAGVVDVVWIWEVL